jgi:hypothetical protein
MLNSKTRKWLLKERRAFLSFLVGAAGGWIVNATLDKVSGQIHKALLSDSGAPEQLHKRLDLEFELFLRSEGRTDFSLPEDWTAGPPDVVLPNGKKTYGHEAVVLKTIARFLDRHMLITWDVRDKAWNASRDGSRVMLASGSSNLDSARIIGTPAMPFFSTKLRDQQINLAYAIGMGTGELTRLQYHKSVTRNRLAICNPDQAIVVQAAGDCGMQVDDYLLVTRVPGPLPRTVVTVLSGLHGPGTRAAELLFNNTVSGRDLEELASAIDYEPGKPIYYQAVFRASAFTEVDGSSVPTEIELVTEGCPPVRLQA